MLSPRLIISAITPITLLMLALTYLCIKQMPYLGFVLEQAPDSEHLYVVATDEHSAHQGLRIEDQVTHIVSAGGVLELHGGHFMQTVAERRRHYPSKNDRFVHQAEIYQVLSHPSVEVITSDGKQITIDTTRQRPLSSVSYETWVRFGCGFIVWFAAMIIWAWRPFKPDTTFLMLSGLGMFINSIASAIYAVDMHILHPSLARTLSFFVGIGLFMFASCGLAFLLYFPQTLNIEKLTRKILLPGTALYALITFFNDWDFQKGLFNQELYFSDAEHYYYVYSSYLAFIVFSLLQRRQARNNPIDKASTAWVILSWAIGTSTFIFLYYLPLHLTGDTYLNRTGSWLTLTATYLMLLFGAARFKFFKLEAHVNSAWQWFLISIVFIILDLLLIKLTDSSPENISLALLAIILWVYIPARNWIYEKLTWQRNQKYYQLFNNSVQNILNISRQQQHSPKEIWQKTIDTIFSPQVIRTSKIPCPETTLINQGQGICIAANSLSDPLYCEHAEKGKRLFTEHDKQLLQTLERLFEHVIDFKDAFLSGQTQERKRIRQDLHDQIGHKLLSLIYATDKNEKAHKLASETMEQLREILRALNYHPMPLRTVIAECCQIAEESCQLAGLTLQLSDTIDFPQQTISSHTYLNLLNILRELLNNTVRHSQATSISIHVSCTDDSLKIVYADDGCGFDPSNTTKGFGLNNINDRAKEIQAKIDWQTTPSMQMSLIIPTQTENLLRWKH
jgi:signal transduction histidine kinase